MAIEGVLTDITRLAGAMMERKEVRLCFMSVFVPFFLGYFSWFTDQVLSFRPVSPRIGFVRQLLMVNDPRKVMV